MSKYRKALKNYKTQAQLPKMVSDIQLILLDAGATGISFEYDNDGRFEAIYFKLEIEGQTRLFSVPVMLKSVSEVLRQQKQFKNVDHAYRVCVANIRDWLDSQLAYLATQQVKFEQIFLPYMVDPQTGKTVFEVIESNKFSIGVNQHE